MKSLWTKFLTGIAVAGMLMTNSATVSAGGNKGFSFGGGGGGGGNSMRSHSSGSSGSQSMKSFARSLSSNQGQSNSFKSHGSNNSSNGSSLGRSLNQFKAHSQGSNSNQFSNLSKSLKSNSRQNLGSQLLGNSNQLKSMQRIGQLNQGQNKAFDQMLRSAKASQGNHNSNKSHSLQSFMGGQFGNKDFNPTKFNGSNKHNNFFTNFDKHIHHAKKDFFFGDHHHDHHGHGHHDHNGHHHHGHHHHNNLWWAWNDPWCYQPYYYNSYPTYGSYPYYNSSVTSVAPLTTPAVSAPSPLAPQLPLADLVLADLRVMDPGNGTDQGPLFQITIANQGPSESPPFQTALIAAASKEHLDSAVKATAQVGPIQPGKTAQVEVRLPIEAMALQGPTGPTMFGVLGVALDDLGQVDELDEQNNRGLVNRDEIRPLDGAAAPQSKKNPSFAASGSNVPSMLSLPPQ